MSNTLYSNYHKHDHVSNIFVPDTYVMIEDYAKRAVELGHKTLWTTNHGTGGDIFEAKQFAEKYGLKCMFGVEGYIVPDVSEKDKSNYHIIIIPKTNKARKKVNLITSHASETGFYYKPRIKVDDLLALDPDDVYITNACVAGLLSCETAITNIFIPLVEHFGENFLLEVQNHDCDIQKQVNKLALYYAKEYGLKLVAANDSHYIYSPEGAKDRLEFLKGKSINYGEEDVFILDYPDYDTFLSRFIRQGILTKSQAEDAIKNTLIFEQCEEINIDKSIKMPSIYQNLSASEKIVELKKHVNTKFKQVAKDDEIPKEKLAEYKQGVVDEVKVIEDTSEINTADYFLFNEKLVDLAVNKYGGVLTRTGRGSCGGFYTNRVLGITQLDRFNTGIKLYPERFMSTARLLENRSMPDVDFNVKNQEPFVQAAKELLGEHGCYPMIAYGTMQLGEAFRNVCRSHDLPFDDFNEVGKDIENHLDDPKWKPYIDEAQKYVGVIVSASVHPCFCGDELVYTDKGYIEIKNLLKDDKVLSHDGSFHRVLKTMVTKNRKIGELKIDGQCVIKVTDNHPFLVRHKTSHTGSYKRLTEAKWKPVSNLIKDDYVFIPINNNAIIPKFDNINFSNEFLWIIGRWVGDGWLKKRYNNRPYEYIIQICCNKDENQEIRNILDKTNYRYWIDNERTTIRFNIQDKNLYTFLRCFGKGADNKFIPQFIIDLPKELLKSFVEGYLSADGCRISKNSFSFTTISKSLALGMQNCINKVFGTYCHLTSYRRKDSYLEGRLLKGNLQYIGQFTINSKRKDYVFDANGLWVRFVDFKLLDKKIDVYNIEVADTHTYTVNNVICHNCAFAMDNKDLREEYGIVRIGDALCCMITSGEADAWKILKDDFLIVVVWKLISETFKLIGKPIISVKELMSSLDEKCWKLLADGITCTLNQVDSDWATELMKKYKAHTVEEGSMFVAALRPSFDSWRDMFINREPYSTGSKQLDEVLKSTGGMILFQENLMQYFDWLGITPAESIGLIKKISKKKIHPEDFQKLEERLKAKWVENTGSIDHFDETWKMIQSCMAYGFCSAHALATFTDCLYGCYLKANYPLQYYQVALTEYSGDMERTKRLTKELEYFHIELKDIKFGRSKANYNADLENRVIYKGVSALKFLNTTVADELYELSQKKQYKTFDELLPDMLQLTSINSRQLYILIALGYFSDFGDAGKLLSIVDIYNTYSGKKLLKKETCTLPREVVLQFATETEKQYRVTDSAALVSYLCENAKPKEFTLSERLASELEYLGYISFRSKDARDKYSALVVDTNTSFSPKITVYNLYTGKTETIKCYKKTFAEQPLAKGMIITYYTESKQRSRLNSETKQFEKIPNEFEQWFKWYQIKELPPKETK